MSKTVLTPTEALSALIERATNGEEVTAEELALANAAVQLSELQEVGETRREKKRAEQAADKAREDAKAEAAKIMKGRGIDSILARYDAAVTALESIVSEVDEYNAAIEKAGRVMSKGGVLPFIDSFLHPEEAQQVRANPKFDEENIFAQLYGKVTSVRIAGEDHAHVTAAPLVAWATITVADQHDGLPLLHGKSISRRLDSPDKGDILERRGRAAA